MIDYDNIDNLDDETREQLLEANKEGIAYGAYTLVAYAVLCAKKRKTIKIDELKELADYIASELDATI